MCLRRDTVLINQTRIEKTKDGIWFYDLHIGGEVYPEALLTDSGFFLCADVGMDLKKAYKSFTPIFPAEDIYIYMPEKGFYANRLKDHKKYDKEESLKHFLARQKNEEEQYAEKRLDEFMLKLKRADLKDRGLETNEDGTVIVQLRGKTFEVSDHDSDKCLNLALFGGFLGLHRFYLGKKKSGFLYLFSAGLLCLGWFTDILLLFLMRFKDARGRLIVPSDSMDKKAIMLFFVTFEACIVLSVYLLLLEFILSFFFI